MNREDRYVIGFSDPRMEYGDPKVTFEPIKVSWWARDWSMGFAYFMLVVCASMAIAPMAWVYFFKWVFA